MDTTLQDDALNYRDTLDSVDVHDTINNDVDVRDTIDDDIPMSDTLENYGAETIDHDLSFVPGDLQGIFPGARSDKVARVLIVDDEPYVLRAIQRLLRDQPLETITAPNGQAGLDILKAQEISLIISDQFMPGMSGTELLAHAQEVCPDTVRVMLTGNNDLTTAIEAINQGDVFRFITKPWRNDELLRIVELGLEQYDLRHSHRMYQEFLKRQNESLATLNTELERRVAERTELLAASEKRIKRLYRDLQESFDATLKIMLSIMELGDIHIVDHCQRTASLVQEFCDYLKLDARQVKPLVRAALLHWIGLISAPGELLLHDQREFAPEEEAAWEFHPLLGYQALMTVPALETSGLIILKYLTRADDTSFRPGVPMEGLEETPVDEALVLSCRILHICSTFERCRTVLKRRGERDLATVFERGLRELRLGKGTLFDTKLVESFDEFVVERFLSRRAEVSIPSVAELRPKMILSRPLATLRGVPVAPRELELTRELIDRLRIFEQTGGLGEIFVWA